MKINKKPFSILILMVGLVAALTFACTDDSDDTPIGKAPEVETGTVSDITSSSAVCSAEITDNGNLEITQSGLCYSTTEGPTTEDIVIDTDVTEGSFTGELTGLVPETTYYIRAFATNKKGTTYGKSVEFKTEAMKIQYGANVNDIDGNVYRTVIIGSQTWMVENLKVTKYNDGTAIETTTDENKWNSLTNGGYCWYLNNEVAYKTPYGALYNWYAVNTGKLCPAGWHVPTNDEWETLSTYLGGTDLAGEKLKETGTTHWLEGISGNNASGFEAVAAGTRNYIGTSYGLGEFSCFWSSTVPADLNASYWQLSYQHSGLTTYNLNKAAGYSVRCIKD